MQAARPVTDFLVYRWRYWIGYIVLGAALVGLLWVAGVYTPGGVSEAEIASTARSATLTASPEYAVQAPYHLLQRASLKWVDVGTLGIKLPSLLLGLLAAVGMFLLLRLWFRPNVALIASAVTIATGQFLTLSQSGTPDILYVFWPTWLVLAGTMMVRRRGLVRAGWAAVFAVLAALSLYTPLSLYSLVAFVITVALHPHLRHLVRHLPRWLLIAGGLVSGAVLVPLVVALMIQPSLGLTLLGIEGLGLNSGLPGQLYAQLQSVVGAYVLFAAPTYQGFMTPVFSLGALALILVGVVALWRLRYTSRAYLIVVWLSLLVPAVILMPAASPVLFVPSLLLLAMGLYALIAWWYRLFPQNPYARVAALGPLAVLVGILVLSGVERFVYGYYYDPAAARQFSYDIPLAKQAIRDQGDRPVVLVVPAEEQHLYTILLRRHPQVTVSTIWYQTTGGATIAAGRVDSPKAEADRILTTPLWDQADRFYVYQK